MRTPIGADEQGVKTPWRRAPTELGLSAVRGLERCTVTSLYAKQGELGRSTQALAQACDVDKAFPAGIVPEIFNKFIRHALKDGV